MQKRQNNEAGIESQAAKKGWKLWNNSKKAIREFRDLNYIKSAGDKPEIIPYAHDFTTEPLRWFPEHGRD